ncbi:MAG: ApbE family lipoprotein [Dethiosulfovibrio peptidovorans]|nr:MAG: ApbE family lipoprotein [Dethiosulfovibrio peptidovorans]
MGFIRRFLLGCFVLILLSLLFRLFGPLSPRRSETKSTFFAMDTVMTIQAYGVPEAVINRCVEVITDLDWRWSVTNPAGEITALNRDGKGAVSGDTAEVIRLGCEYGELTDGALDISIYPVVRLWGFTSDDQTVPDEMLLCSSLEKVSYKNIQCDGERVLLSKDMALDLGGIAKGYAGDLLIQLLRSNGATSALLNLGGNVQCLGRKPDGGPWRVAVQNPFGDGYVGVVAAADEAVVTSGGYRRYFVDSQGHRRWHILDSATGMPAESGLTSVTVVGKGGAHCDALSTAFFVMGLDRTVTYWRKHGGIDVILVTQEGNLYVTASLASRFTPSRTYARRYHVLDEAGGVSVDKIR